MRSKLALLWVLAAMAFGALFGLVLGESLRGGDKEWLEGDGDDCRDQPDGRSEAEVTIHEAIDGWPMIEFVEFESDQPFRLRMRRQAFLALFNRMQEHLDKPRLVKIALDRSRRARTKR